MNHQTVLVVDDSIVIRNLISHLLNEEGYKVLTAASAEEAMQRIQQRGLPHIALVDINLPGIDGFTFCHRLQSFCDVPIIIISSEGDEEHVMRGLDSYAEDYIVKTGGSIARSGELVSRVRRVLSRIDDFTFANPVITIDDYLQINFAQRDVWVNGQQISLTPTENKLLHVLVRHIGRTLSSEFLLQRVWPNEEAYEDRLHTHLYRLRRKIESNPKEPVYIISDWGRGYSFGVAAAEKRN